MKEISTIVKSFKESIFSQMSALAQKHNAINLSQGLPNFDGPEWVQELACKAIRNQQNQSSPSRGVSSLRKAISNNCQKYYDIKYNPETEIVITNGATEAIYSTVQALVDPGDEVIVFEPFFDTYIPAIELAGGKPVVVTLHAPSFSFKEEELKSAFSDKTKLVIINTPHNPSGKIFSREELETIAKYINQYDSFLVSDEVYEYLLYDSQKHIPPASLNNLTGRTITVSSTGKTFGFTGWRIGWAAAPAKISHAIQMVHQNCTFTAPRPLQEAMAIALTKLDEHLPEFKATYQAKRNLLFKGLDELGFSPILPYSTYFITCPISNFTKKSDVEFAMELIEKCKVATIPTSAFYSLSSEGSNYLRFSFAKSDEALNSAITKLREYLHNNP